jgi:hypothetical protein
MVEKNRHAVNRSLYDKIAEWSFLYTNRGEQVEKKHRKFCHTFDNRVDFSISDRLPAFVKLDTLNFFGSKQAGQGFVSIQRYLFA